MTADARAWRRIGIIGTGRVANALGLALARHSSEPPYVWGRNPANAAAVVAAIGRGETTPLRDLVQSCDVILIAVADDAIAPLVATLASTEANDSPFAFHVSGRSGTDLLAPLVARGWRTAAIHPAMTFTGDPLAEVARMVGARFAVTGSTPDSTNKARSIVRLVGGAPVDIAETDRPLYHAALCHGSNHLVTLIADASDALTRAGVDDPGALLAPLARAALDNALARGIGGLSGPLLRDDQDTIAGHLAALRSHAPALLTPYRAMAVATLDALEREDPARALGTCRALLTPD